MTLQDAVDLQFYERPFAHIVREDKLKDIKNPWFFFTRGRLHMQSWTPSGYKVTLATFKLSPNTDWILI
jgi:hypothetical protein